MDSMRFAGKTALVTGAASGIGKEVVDTFVKEGARVVAADKAFPLAAVGFVGQTRSVHLDVSREVEWENLLKEITQLDVVVACAGISEAKPILDTSLCDWQRVMAANLGSAFSL